MLCARARFRLGISPGRTASGNGIPTPVSRPARAAIPGSAATASPASRVRAAAATEPKPAPDGTAVSSAAATAAAEKDPAGTAKDAKSAGAAKPAGGANTNQASKPADAAKTAGATKTAETAKPAGGAKPTGGAKTAGTAAAAKATKTAAGKSTRTARTTRTTKTAGAAKSTGAGKANGAAASATTAAKTKSNGAAKTTAKTRTRKRTTTARRPKLQYKVGQQLVYPLQGVGQVTTIEERPFRDDTLLYYVVYLEVSDMTIMVPVEKADELGIRAIVPRPEANGALRLISEDYEPIPTDWKLRYQMNLDLLKAGSVSDIATVVRALYHRSRIKELPILERKLYDNARSLLVDELSFSLGKDKDTIEEMINARLEAGVKP